MKFFLMIRRIFCLAAVMLVIASACGAEEAFVIEDTGLELSEALSIHYPTLSGSADVKWLI